jgi:hypothetical protein
MKLSSSVEVDNLINLGKFHFYRAAIVLILARVSVYIRFPKAIGRSLQCIAMALAIEFS